MVGMGWDREAETEVGMGPGFVVGLQDGSGISKKAWSRPIPRTGTGRPGPVVSLGSFLPLSGSLISSVLATKFIELKMGLWPSLYLLAPVPP
jgi:hypothetical protein